VNPVLDLTTLSWTPNLPGVKESGGASIPKTMTQHPAYKALAAVLSHGRIAADPHHPRPPGRVGAVFPQAEALGRAGAPSRA